MCKIINEIQPKLFSITETNRKMRISVPYINSSTDIEVDYDDSVKKYVLPATIFTLDNDDIETVLFSGCDAQEELVCNYPDGDGDMDDLEEMYTDTPLPQQERQPTHIRSRLEYIFRKEIYRANIMDINNEGMLKTQKNNLMNRLYTAILLKMFAKPVRPDN
jgi:hypothetical protein